jgi:hypothetical protein
VSALLNDRCGHRAALDASFRLTSRLRTRPGGVSGTPAPAKHAGKGELAAGGHFASTTTSGTGNFTGGDSAIPDNSRTNQGNDSVSERPSQLDSRTGNSAGEITASPRRGPFSRRSVASSRLAEQVFSSTYSTGNDDAAPKPTFSDPHIAAREAYTSRRKQLEEDYFGQADPYGAELQSTPLARDSVVVQEKQHFRSRLPTESVGRHISHVRDAQIVQGASKTPTLL